MIEYDSTSPTMRGDLSFVHISYSVATESSHNLQIIGLFKKTNQRLARGQNIEIFCQRIPYSLASHFWYLLRAFPQLTTFLRLIGFNATESGVNPNYLTLLRGIY